MRLIGYVMLRMSFGDGVVRGDAMHAVMERIASLGDGCMLEFKPYTVESAAVDSDEFRSDRLYHDAIVEVHADTIRYGQNVMMKDAYNILDRLKVDDGRGNKVADAVFSMNCQLV